MQPPARTPAAHRIGRLAHRIARSGGTDTQSWLDTPATNFGWIVIGNESVLATAKRFDTRENSIASARPALTVDFTTAAPGSGRVPDGGAIPGNPLTVAHAAGGDLRLSWGASCATTDTDYEIYAGAIPDYTRYSPILCSTGGLTSTVLTPSAAGQIGPDGPTRGLASLPSACTNLWACPGGGPHVVTFCVELLTYP